jgi:hypothetical protein
MRISLSRYRDWFLAGTVVTVVYLGGICTVFLPVSESIHGDILTVLALPSILLLLPILFSNIHNPDLGDIPTITLAVVLNWLFYTAILRWVLARLRRRKSSKQETPASLE